MARSVKISDIANALNLSRNTVSKVLNNKPVPEKTRQLVLAKARELNYKNLGSEWGERPGNKKKILLLSGHPIETIDYFHPIISRLEFRAEGYNWALIRSSLGKGMTFDDIKDVISKIGAEGVICVEALEKGVFKQLISLNIPCVFYDYPYFQVFPVGNYDVVFCDSENLEKYILLQVIRQTGAQHFTFIGDPFHCSSFYKRYTTFLSVLSSVGIEHSRKEDLLENDASSKYTLQYLPTFFRKLPQIPDMVVCTNDFRAMQVQEALDKLLVSIPEKTQILGFDIDGRTKAHGRSITSIGCDQLFIADQMMENMASRLKEQSIPSRHTYISGSLFLGGSTRLKKI